MKRTYEVLPNGDLRIMSRGLKAFMIMSTWFFLLGLVGVITVRATFVEDGYEKVTTSIKSYCKSGVMVEEDRSKDTVTVVMEQTGEHQFTAVRCKSGH